MSTDYPSDWDSRRKEVYQRDGHQCQNCGRQGGPHGSTELHAHHIVPKSKGGTHQRSNLITVCKDCHNAIHGKSSAPTGQSRISSEEELYAKLFEMLNNISDGDMKSNDAMDRLIEMIENTNNGSDFSVDEYSTIRYEVIKQAFSVKESIEEYESTTRNYLAEEAKTDVDTYISEAWESIKKKIFAIGHADDLLMEYADRDIICNECGERLEPDSKFCKNCGDEVEMIPECKSCGNELDPDSNFCSQCGNEIDREIESDQHAAVDQVTIANHTEELTKEINEAIEQTLFVQLLEEKFQTVWINDYDVLWNYCPNCGLERGVLITSREAVCILCESKWEKKGILSTYWEAINTPNIETDKDDSEIAWNNLGKKKNSEELYREYLSELEPV